jgi:hypothetical protein
MKRWLPVVAALAAVSLALTPVAFAHGHGHVPAGKAKGRAQFQCQAQVFSVDPANLQLVVTVKSGSKAIKAYRGQQVTLLVSASAKLINGTSNVSPLTLDQLVQGATVHVGGNVTGRGAGETFTATKIILQKLPAPASTASPTPAP